MTRQKNVLTRPKQVILKKAGVFLQRKKSLNFASFEGSLKLGDTLVPTFL